MKQNEQNELYLLKNGWNTCRAPGNGIENNIETAPAPYDGADYYTYNKQQRFETDGEQDPGNFLAPFFTTNLQQQQKT